MKKNIFTIISLIVALLACAYALYLELFPHGENEENEVKAETKKPVGKKIVPDSVVNSADEVKTV